MTRTRWFLVVPCAVALALVLGGLNSSPVAAQHGATPQSIDEAIWSAIASSRDAGGPAVVYSDIAPGNPTDFSVTLNGGNVILGWKAPVGGDPASSYLIQITDRPLGSVPPPAPLSFPTGSTATSLVVPIPPPGNYCVTVRALNDSGLSGPSNEICYPAAGAPGPGPCALLPAPVLQNPTVTGNSVTLNWGGVGGAVSYLLQGGPTPGSTALSLPIPGTSFTVNGVPAGTFFARVSSQNGCGAGGPSNEVTGTVAGGTPGPGPTPSGPRLANPAPGTRLPRPTYGEAIVRQVAAAFPGDLQNSCAADGGNNTWLFRLVQALRNIDTRWGLNWKRGNRGDMSQDIVDYHYGPGPDEDSTDVYIFDAISGHCGPDPDWNWTDVTDVTVNSGTIGRWTLAGRFFNP